MERRKQKTTTIPYFTYCKELQKNYYNYRYYYVLPQRCFSLYTHNFFHVMTWLNNNQQPMPPSRPPLYPPYSLKKTIKTTWDCFYNIFLLPPLFFSSLFHLGFRNNSRLQETKKTHLIEGTEHFGLFSSLFVSSISRTLLLLYWVALLLP